MHIKKFISHPLVIVLISGLAVAGVIYLSPLKHLNVIPVSINEISPQSFYDTYQDSPEKYLVIDVRTESEYASGHIEGAVHIPLYFLYERWDELPRTDKEVVLVCDRNRQSGIGYHYLEHHGFLNLMRITDGMAAWSEGGLPVIIETPN